MSAVAEHAKGSARLEQLRIYKDDELVFDGFDPDTYTICEIAE